MEKTSSKRFNMLITIPNSKNERFNFLDNVYARLLERFENEVNIEQPLHLKTINGFLGRIYHIDKQTIKILVNDLARKNLVEIKRGSGIANYFIILRRIAK